MSFHNSRRDTTKIRVTSVLGDLPIHPPGLSVSESRCPSPPGFLGPPLQAVSAGAVAAALGQDPCPVHNSWGPGRVPCSSPTSSRHSLRPSGIYSRPRRLTKPVCGRRFNWFYGAGQEHLFRGNGNLGGTTEFRGGGQGPALLWGVWVLGPAGWRVRDVRTEGTWRGQARTG